MMNDLQAVHFLRLVILLRILQKTSIWY